MSALPTRLRMRPILWMLVGAGLLLVVLANVHLVYVAVTSQPDCVTHLRAGERAAQPGQFRAAQSACSPR